METIIASAFPRRCGFDLDFGNLMLRLVPVESGAGAGVEQDGGGQGECIDCLLKTQPFWQISCCSVAVIWLCSAGMAGLTPGMLRGLGTRRLPSASGNWAKSSGQSPQEWSGSFKRRPTFDLQSSFWPSGQQLFHRTSAIVFLLVSGGS